MVRIPCLQPEATSIVLVDTPGFDNGEENMFDTKISGMLQSWHGHMYVQFFINVDFFVHKLCLKTKKRSLAPSDSHPA